MVIADYPEQASSNLESVARQFEQAARALHQVVEPLPRGIIGESCAIFRSFERENHLELPAEFQRDLRRNLVGAVCDRRYEP